MHSRRRSSSSPVNTVVVGIAGSRRCSSEPAGRWAKTGWSVSGVARELKVPQKQKPRGRWLWLNDGSCVRLRPTHRNHVWSYDFVSARTHDGRSVRLLNLIDEHTRESLLVRAQRRWSSSRVISALADVMVMKGSTGTSSLGQWAGVRRQRLTELAGQHRSKDAVHRAWLSVGERLLRELQL